jgi:hypothetical protein
MITDSTITLKLQNTQLWLMRIVKDVLIYSIIPISYIVQQQLSTENIKSHITISDKETTNIVT